MRLIKSAAIAVSMYSRIPVPQVNWDDSYMKHVLCFLPLIGAVIGGLETGWYFLAQHLGASVLLFAAIAALIPVIVTGGLHLDGLMDTHDALASFGDPEKRHAILKDPHSGAFAVIHCCMYFLVSAGCCAHLYEKNAWREFAAVSIGYIISRSICALCVVFLPCARDSGLAYLFKTGAGKGAVAVTGIVFLIAAAGALVWLSPIAAAFTAIAAVLAVLHFQFTVIRKFMGITGDLAGYFLTRIELLAALSAAGGLLVKGAFGI